MDQKQINETDADVILVGGGLANCLIAHWLAEERPDILIAMIESGPKICGNHIWPFPESSIARSDYRRLQPFISRRWTKQDFVFEKFMRSSEQSLACVSGEMLRNAILANPRVEVLQNTPVTKINSNSVELAGDEYITAPLVIDGRGHHCDAGVVAGKSHSNRMMIKLSEPHNVTAPITMDANVVQDTRIRHFQVLPLSADELSIKQTILCLDDDAPTEGEMSRETLSYASENGWNAEKSELLHHSVQPIIRKLNTELFWKRISKAAMPVGGAAALYHHTTLDGLAPSVRIANLLADCEDLSTAGVKSSLEPEIMSWYEEQQFMHSLNDMLLEPDRSGGGISVFEHLFGLSQVVIDRFYAGQLWSRDKIRISMVKPSAPIAKAIGGLGRLNILKRS